MTPRTIAASVFPPVLMLTFVALGQTVLTDSAVHAEPTPIPLPPYYANLPADFAQSYLQGYNAFLYRSSSDYPPANVRMSPNDTISWICLSQQRAARSRGEGPAQASAFNEGCLHAARANAGP